MNIAPILRDALDLWQNPPFTALSVDSILAAANRCLSKYHLDLDLTADACFSTLVGEPFTFDSSTAREAEVDDAGDISRILRIESRPVASTSEDDWTEEKASSFENWNRISERGDDNFVSIYRDEDGLIQMRVARDVSDLEFRVIYKVLQAAITTVSADSILPDIYIPLMTYDLAIEFSELIDDLSPEFQIKKRQKMPYLEGRYQESADQIDKWQRSQRGTGPVRRRAFNDRVPNIIRRRITL